MDPALGALAALAAAPALLLALALALPPSVPTTLKVWGLVRRVRVEPAAPQSSASGLTLSRPARRDWTRSRLPTAFPPSAPHPPHPKGLPGLANLYLQLLRAALRKGKVPKSLKGHKEVKVRLALPSGQLTLPGSASTANSTQFMVLLSHKRVVKMVQQPDPTATLVAKQLPLQCALLALTSTRQCAYPSPPQLTVSRALPFDPSRYAGFLRLVGFKGTPKTVPLMYPVVESFRLSMLAMSHPDFPFNVLGAVLARNSTQVARPIAVDEKLAYT
jgi:hypothetical protein